MQSRLTDFYETNVSPKEALGVLQETIQPILDNHFSFFRTGRGLNSVAGTEFGNPVPQMRGVRDLEDIEELIWSPILGLKGKIDATVRIRTKRSLSPLQLWN